MFEAQTATRMNEQNRCHDRSWLAIEEQKRFDVGSPADMGEYRAELVGIEPEPSKAHYEGLIHIGQKVFLGEDLLIGLTTKLFLSQDGQISHVAIRTARLLGSHKMVPVASICAVTPFRITLNINREQFTELPEYQTDATLAEEADRALWKDVVLRGMDYHQIDVQVQDGAITLNGHVMTSMNQWRAETAVKNIPGILGVRSYLIPDDKLTLEVAGALGQMEQDTGSKFFTKVENGVVVLVGDVSSTALRDQAEQCVAEIPWVRGIINEIHAPGVVLDPEDQRFLQPRIGRKMSFKDSISVNVQKVVINPHNRRVVAMVVSGSFPDPLEMDRNSKYRGESNLKRQVVLPVGLILFLTRSTGSININSEEITEYENYDPTCYISPAQDWLPPYPYCTDDVLFLAQL